LEKAATNGYNSPSFFSFQPPGTGNIPQKGGYLKKFEQK
jgi:hypothetical protein